MASRSTLLLLLLFGVSANISWLNKVGGVSSNVAELQSERWREKLPEVAMPQTIVDRLSPLSLTQMQNLAAGLKNMDAASFDAQEFCRSAGLICREDVDFPPARSSIYGFPSAERRAIKRHEFFDKKELQKSGKIMLPDLRPPNYLISFLPSELAEMMPPFSSANVSQILNLLKISKESNMSRSMGHTLEKCEKRVEEGEVKRCSTSIEGMVEFVVSLLGSDVDLLTDTSAVGSGQRVTVTKASKRENVVVGGKPPVTCHIFAFPYGVSYCHSIKGSEVFDLQLEIREEKGKVRRNATALCHYFYSNGTGRYYAACHPVFGEMLLWTPKPKPKPKPKRH